MRDFDQPGRSAAMGENGMAATSHPLATQAALDVLREGGNAADAAIAAVAVLCVVEPAMTGVGGDCFCIYTPAGDQPVALNGSGRAPAAISPDWLRERGVDEITPETPHAVTIPGAVDAWHTLAERFGTLGMDRLLAPAIAYAEDGYPVMDRVAHDWKDNRDRLAADEHARAVFLPNGTAPAPGDRHAQPKLGATLRGIVEKGREGFYEGPVMADIVARLQELGGAHADEDFATKDKTEFCDTVSFSWRGLEIHECPPNGQGVTALMLLNLLEACGFHDMPDASEADRIHLFTEATKMAYAARDSWISDPAFSNVPVDRFLSTEWAGDFVGAFDPGAAVAASAWEGPVHRDTTYLTVVDRDRNAMSLINSLFHAFGSCIMAPESGVLLHCRGMGFNSDPNHPNAIGPNKRPLHTIIPALVCRDGRPEMPFGVMGGQYQAAGHAHFLDRVYASDLDPQQAAEAPRHFSFGGVLELEPRIGEDTAVELCRRGHEVAWAEKPIGGAQAIRIDEARGVLVGGSDPRKDGLALGY